MSRRDSMRDSRSPGANVTHGVTGTTTTTRCTYIPLYNPVVCGGRRREEALEMSFPKPANHDRRCQVCEGTGWEQAPLLKSKANGFDVAYTQLIPCTNEFWWQDDPTVDADGYSRTIPIPAGQGRVIAARAYADECRRQGREPDWDMFNRIVGQL